MTQFIVRDCGVSTTILLLNLFILFYLLYIATSKRGASEARRRSISIIVLAVVSPQSSFAPP